MSKRSYYQNYSSKKKQSNYEKNYSYNNPYKKYNRNLYNNNYTSSNTSGQKSAYYGEGYYKSKKNNKKQLRHFQAFENKDNMFIVETKSIASDPYLNSTDNLENKDSSVANNENIIDGIKETQDTSNNPAAINSTEDNDIKDNNKENNSNNQNFTKLTNLSNLTNQESHNINKETIETTESSSISNININFNFNQQDDSKKSLTKVDKLERLEKLQNKIVATSLVQNGIRAFFQRLRINKDVKEIETHSNSINSFCISSNSPNSISNSSGTFKKFTGLKIINSEIFEKLDLKTETVIQQGLIKCFKKLKSLKEEAKEEQESISEVSSSREKIDTSGTVNTTDKASVSISTAQNPTTKRIFNLSINKMLNIEYTDFLNTVESAAGVYNWSITSFCFSLVPKKKREEFELER